jgi:hypothetical protein
MIEVSYAAGRVIADDSTALFNAADNALLISARFTVSILEAAAEARLDPRMKQRLLESISAGQSKLVDSRKSFTSLHSQLVVLQRGTNLAEVDWSCSGLPSWAKPSASQRSADEEKAVESG